MFLLCALFRSEGPARSRKESNGVSDDRLFDRLRRDERLETRDERDRETREPFFFSITLLSSHLILLLLLLLLVRLRLLAFRPPHERKLASPKERERGEREERYTKQ